ncbi:MAG TPA: aspartate carbamoyltransferase [Candidatus Saccharimonadales bacterium]|nr:aspartate carbamoyltransferase [Candidatus Saccharimonadales bacterium]
MHLISASQIDKKQLEKIFERADYFKSQADYKAGRKKTAQLYAYHQLASIFFQPSTRTRLSFETAAVRLGMGVISTENAREHSSSAKGETIDDTFKILDGYKYDVIVMRHYEAGAAARAAAVCKTPIINAGDGMGEHPSQSLLDAYTIYKAHGRLDNLDITFGGDLRFGRTVRSLSKILALYPNNRITFVSIPELKVTADIKKYLDQKGTSYSETTDVPSALAGADVVYWTRLQKEYLRDPNSIPAGFTINKQSLKSLKKSAVIMHPLPRIDEITPETDSDPRAIYFQQAANGLFVRMALIDYVLSSN